MLVDADRPADRCPDLLLRSRLLEHLQELVLVRVLSFGVVDLYVVLLDPEMVVICVKEFQLRAISLALRALSVNRSRTAGLLPE